MSHGTAEPPRCQVPTVRRGPGAAPVETGAVLLRVLELSRVHLRPLAAPDCRALPPMRRDVPRAAPDSTGIGAPLRDGGLQLPQAHGIIGCMSPTPCVTIVGGGLAGAEAAWQAAERGVPVRLIEMRPVAGTAAHRTALLAELVCSNSLKSQELTSGSGLLHAGGEGSGSIVQQAARAHAVPAGTALAVDRTAFAQEVTRRLGGHPLVTVYREEVT